MPPNRQPRVLVNLAELDPPRNGGQSRVAFMVARILAEAAHAGQADVHFVVGWRFATEFERWLGISGLQVVPFHPELDMPTGLCAHLRPDLIVSPLSGMWPFGAATEPKSARHIAAMPDAMALDLPELLEAGERNRRAQSYEELKKAALVVTDSAHARGRLMAHLALPAEVIRIIPPAAAPVDDSIPLPASLISGRYVFYPANGWPHKRHRLLLQAMKLMLSEEPGLKLVLAGWQPHRYIEDLLLEVGLPAGAIVNLGYVRNDGWLKWLYRNAQALMFTSSYEGFGMPVIEAMQNDCPVICARETALPEVAEAAALYVEGDRPADWARAYLEELPPRREELIGKGRQQASQFGWEHSRRLWEAIFEEVGVDLHQSAESAPSPDTDYQTALRELVAWSGRYAAAMTRLDEKEANLSQFRERLRTSPRVWLANSPLGRFWLYRAAARLAKLPLSVLFPAGGFELIQHAPRPLAQAPVRAPGVTPPEALPSIGIVTPCLNSANYIEAALRSVTEQEYPRLQYAVQDGGSSDGTLEILERWKRRLSSCESTPDDGQAAALNMGFGRIEAEIMAYLNADDMLLPGALQYVGEYFAAHPQVDVIYSHRICVDENGDEVGRWILPAHDGRTLYWADYVPQETLFWRRRVWERCGGALDASFNFALDWDLLLRFQEAGAVIRRVPRFLAVFRVHALQKTSARMSTTGAAEMDRVREKYLGRRPSVREIARHVHGYQLRSLLYRQAWHLGLLRS